MSVTYNGVAMTLLETCQYSGGTAHVRTFGLLDPTVGTNTVSVTWTGSSYGRGVSSSYYNVGSIDVSTSDNLAPTTTATVTLTSSFDESRWYGAAVGANTTSGDTTGSGSLTTVRVHVSDRILVGDSNGTIGSGSKTGGFYRSAGSLTGVSGIILKPSVVPANSPSASAAPTVIQLVGTKSGSGTGAVTLDLTALTGGLGSAAEEDDIVLLAFSYHSGVDQNMAPTTSGYTELADLYQNDGFDTNLWVGYKKMGSTPDTSVEVPSVSRPTSVVVQVWRGVDPVTPIDATTTTAGGTNSGIPNPPSITPTTVGATVVAAGATASAALYVSGAPSTFYDYVGTSISFSGDVGSVGLAAKYNWSSGAVDPAAFATTGSDSSSNSCKRAGLFSYR
jgi:hypothetical protein